MQFSGSVVHACSVWPLSCRFFLFEVFVLCLFTLVEPASVEASFPWSFFSQALLFVHVLSGLHLAVLSPRDVLLRLSDYARRMVLAARAVRLLCCCCHSVCPWLVALSVLGIVVLSVLDSVIVFTEVRPILDSCVVLHVNFPIVCLLWMCCVSVCPWFCYSVCLKRGPFVSPFVSHLDSFGLLVGWGLSF